MRKEQKTNIKNSIGSTFVSTADYMETLEDRDFEETFAVSNEVTEHYRNQKNAAVRFAQGLMQILSPLL